MQCQIKWIDDNGQATADTNPAVGRVMLKARVEQIAGRGVKFDASPWYNICACHAKRLTDPGMHNWVFEAFDEPPQPVDDGSRDPLYGQRMDSADMGEC